MKSYIFSLVLIFRFKFTITLSDQPLLLLISLDGLNHKFVTPCLTPNIWSLGQNGVLAAKGIKVQVSTVTAPNHHCIATGLYQESHGIIGNTFYDPVLKETYDIWNFTGNTTTYNRSVLPQWYEHGEPIWQTNMQISGRISGSYLWPMGDAQIPTKYPPHKYKKWLDYGNFSTWVEEIDELLGWFTSETDPINLGLYYNAEPDHSEHHYDLHGENVTATIRQLDNLIGYLIERTKVLGLYERLNFVLTADHGHAEVKSENFTFGIKEFVAEDLVINSSHSLFPREDRNVTADDIYNNLTRALLERGGKGFMVWRKEDFPERYRWKQNRRVGPVIAVYDIHYENELDPRNFSFPHGTHGYLNDYPDMNAFFVAHGPAFKIGFTVDEDFIENIDIYPLMCNILGIQPAPNNGSLERISVVLKDNLNNN